jgi:hypothetical protein
LKLHVAGSGEAPRPPLFLRSGITFVTDRTTAMKSDDVYLPVSVGYEWFWGTHLGVSIDGGLMLLLSHHKESLQSCWACLDIAPPVIPAAHAQMFAYF